MKKTDLQLGDIWTHPEHRGKSLGSLSCAIAIQNRVEYKIWYIVHRENLASIRLAQKLGFKKVGTGRRKSRFGLKSFGYFEFREQLIRD